MDSLLDRLRGLELERFLRLRPPYPPVALQIERGELLLVRLKPKRRGLPLLEAHGACALDPQAVPSSIFDSEGGGNRTAELGGRVRELLESSGTRPGRISLIIPDNLAKVALISLPERPGSRKQLDELVRSQMRRAVPFRLEDASLSYQVIPGDGKGVGILVVLVRRGLLEQYERAVESCGARIGLVDLCTPNLINLCRSRMIAASKAGDAALLNCAGNYFSLAIVRKERLIFFRCKTYAAGEDPAESNGVLSREILNSFSYYEDRLGGSGIGTLFVRSVSGSSDGLSERLGQLGLQNVEPIDASSLLEQAPQVPLDARLGQRLAPAIGAAVGRWSG